MESGKGREEKHIRNELVTGGKIGRPAQDRARFGEAPDKEREESDKAIRGNKP